MKKYEIKINSWLESNNKTTIKWQDLQELLNVSDYDEFVNLVKELVQLGSIKGMGCTFNGRNPRLHSKFKIIKEEVDYSKFINEIDYVITPKIDKSYSRKNMKWYVENRSDILKINNFILNNSDRLNTPVSINERSFQVFGKEKQLRKSKALIKNLGLTEEFFNYYETSEPIAYYSLNRNAPQNILIIENKDTFYTIRKYMKEISSSILGLNIGTVVYGGGKSKIPSLNEFKYYTEDYISDSNNTFYYFGDIDYEGLGIYESYRNRTSGQIDLKPFTQAYKYIVDKCDALIDNLPITKEGQNRNINELFFESFDKSYREKIMFILEKDKYIPQEALNYEDLVNYE